LILEEGLNLITWLLLFGAINWLATDNLWLCFFITAALRLSISNISGKDIEKMMYPVHRDIDEYINELKTKNEELESNVDELAKNLRTLRVRLDEVEHQLNPLQHGQPL
jgi:hypothetical protein